MGFVPCAAEELSEPSAPSPLPVQAVTSREKASAVRRRRISIVNEARRLCVPGIPAPEFRSFVVMGVSRHIKTGVEGLTEIGVG